MGKQANEDSSSVSERTFSLASLFGLELSSSLSSSWTSSPSLLMLENHVKVSPRHPLSLSRVLCSSLPLLLPLCHAGVFVFIPFSCSQVIACRETRAGARGSRSDGRQEARDSTQVKRGCARQAARLTSYHHRRQRRHKRPPSRFPRTPFVAETKTSCCIR